MIKVTRSFVAQVTKVDPRAGQVQLQGQPTSWHMRHRDWEVQRLCRGLVYTFTASDKYLVAWAPEEPGAAQVRAFLKACGATKAKASKVSGVALLEDAGSEMARLGEPEEVQTAAKRYLPAGFAALSRACLLAGARQYQIEEIYTELIKRGLGGTDLVKWLDVHGFELAPVESISATFATLDELTSSRTKEERIAAAGNRLLVAEELKGNAGYWYGTFQSRVAQMAGDGTRMQDVHDLVTSAGSNFSLLTVRDEDKKSSYVFRIDTARRETQTAKGLIAQLQQRLPYPLKLGHEVDYWDDDQRAAAMHIANNPLTILVGPAGSGKTTVVKTVARAIAAAGGVVALTATTGQAAKILDNKHGKTLHSFLQAVPGQMFAYNNDDVDLLVIDETSMLDVTLACPLGHYLQNGHAKRVVLVGDTYQLPPVGPGNVLYDLVHSPVTAGYVKELTKVRRGSQMSHNGKTSDILQLALAIRDGLALPSRLGHRVQALPIDAHTTNTIAELSRHGDCLVITPEYSSELGVYELNKRLRDDRLGVSDDYWLAGERVIQTKSMHLDDNDKKSPIIANGTLGTIKDVNPNGSLHVVYDDGIETDLPANKVRHHRGVIEPAYALTVHRAQGNQAKTVVVVVDPSAPKMWEDPRLGYTAVTRAMDRLVVFGDINLLLGTEHQRRNGKKLSGLPTRLVNRTNPAGRRAKQQVTAR